MDKLVIWNIKSNSDKALKDLLDTLKKFYK